MNGSKRGWWGATATLLGAGLVIAGCQDGYPIAATRCDRWCDLVQATWCGRYNPASCIASKCEPLSGGVECYPEFDQLLTCLEEQPSIGCYNAGDGVVPACAEAQAPLEACVAAHLPHDPTTGE